MAPAVIPGKALAGGLVVLLGWDPAKDHHLLKGVSDLECLHKDLHATTGMSPESLPHGGSGLKGDSVRRCGASCHGKGLAGFAKTASRQGSCRGVPLRPLCSLWSWSWRRSASPELRPYLGSPPLPCSVWWCPWLRLPVHSYRGTKSVPLFLYTDRSPRAWATHKRDTLLGQAQNGARAGGAVFTAVKLFARCASHDPRTRRDVEGCA